jgi:hypothetical protein
MSTIRLEHFNERLSRARARQKITCPQGVSIPLYAKVLAWIRALSCNDGQNQTVIEFFLIVQQWIDIELADSVNSKTGRILVSISGQTKNFETQI